MKCAPTVSVIVPCRNEKDHIETCIRSLLTQEPFAGGFEIIVADGMSDDGTRDILTQLEREGHSLRIVDNLDGITPCGMNAGIHEARGLYIAIMGAHNRYAPDYLRCSMKVLDETKADNVGGAMMYEPASRLERAIAAAHHSTLLSGGARWHDPTYEGRVDTVFGGVYRRDVFEKIGLFDEELVRNQDDEFNLRLMRAGGTIWQSPRIRSWYRPRGSLGALFRQYAQYGYWKVRVIQKHRIPASARHLVPGGFVLSVIAASAASFVWPPAAYALVGILGTYLLANVAASIVTVGGSSLGLFPLVCIVSATYHFAYGLGFLRGIWDLVILRRRPSRAFTKLTRTPRGQPS